MSVNAGGQRLVDDYLERVRTALADWPRRDRAEICENLRAHIEESHASEFAGVDRVKAILVELGPPEDYADGSRRARPRLRIRPYLGLLAEPFVVLAVTVAVMWLWTAWMIWPLAILMLAPYGAMLAWGAVVRGLDRRAESGPGRLPAVVRLARWPVVIHVLGSLVPLTLMISLVYDGRSTLSVVGRFLAAAYIGLGCCHMLAIWLASGKPLLVKSARAGAGASDAEDE